MSNICKECNYCGDHQGVETFDTLLAYITLCGPMKHSKFLINSNRTVILTLEDKGKIASDIIKDEPSFNKDLMCFTCFLGFYLEYIIAEDNHNGVSDEDLDD